MGRKLPFLPTCATPTKTLSFRATTAAAATEFDDMDATEEAESSIESVIRGLSTDRFFFKPGKTSSILEEAKAKETNVLPFKESVAMMEMESTDPFVDFKKSMQEMVEADEGLKEWENLQELLSWYLAVNEKSNHGYIVGAFVDLLLVNLGPSSSSSSSFLSSSMNGQDQSLVMVSSGSNKKLMISSESPESALSFSSSLSSSASSSGTCSSTSHCLSSCSMEEEDDEGDDNHGDGEDHNSAQKAVVPDADASSSSSSSSEV